MGGVKRRTLPLEGYAQIDFITPPGGDVSYMLLAFLN